ncbi:PREDICTED: centrosomal protein of 152 kDa isoform X1 [Gavialis gangeticus]|uniref:centrosomal protein of 152 kDa isoform X1 n=1 Tax=Gavialis gangeticus TaxID=94835 RepID=UPI00092F240F|nr:PREDICTED: centrosomal protein of 152 kDa isoform X1 [Gavialis gangeticus]
MSLDFDSGALQTQHEEEEEEEEYDQEDYAREQELQQLLTDLPHDMLDDSGDQLSNYSDCSVHEDEEQAHEPWQHEGKWNDHPLITNPQIGYEQGERLYPDQFLYDRGNNHGETHASNWADLHNEDEEKCTYEIKRNYSGTCSEADDTYLGRDGYNAPSHYQQNSVYHLPDNFRQYANGHKQEFAGHNQQSKILNFPDAPKEHPKQFATSEVVSSQPVESYKVTYKPYKNGLQQNVPVNQETTRRTEAFEELQREFLGTNENSSDNMQILQLQVLNKAKGRQLEELNEKLEKSTQQIRYLNHQLAMVKDEKDGLALSLQESQKLYQEGKEREVHLEGQVKSLDAQIQALAANEEKILKQSKVAEVAMESMQQQLLELQHSDSLQRAREQHETIVAALKQKYEEQVLSLEQQLDTTNSTLREQKELCCHLGEHVKQLEKTLEQIKCEKTEIINRLTRSLEESQKQCANLLQTGSVQETSQLRFQLQQAQSAQLMSKNMNKALQEELTELKEEIALYESAAKLGVFLNDAGGELRVDMNESYVDLGIKKVNWKKSRFHRAIQNRDKELSKDDLIIELKAELERLLNSNKMKRNQISQLQNDLKDCQRTTDKFQQLLKAEKIARESETKVNNVENHTGILWSNPSASDNLKEEIRRLREMNEALHQEIENHSSSIQNLKANEEKLKSANQDLCSQMRQMIQDFDRDKQEAIDRCERTYQQHHEDAKAQLWKDLLERHATEKEQLIQAYEETISQLKANIEVLNKEIIAVKECYIAVCGEKDTLETTLRRKIEQEQQSKEEKIKEQVIVEIGREWKHRLEEPKEIIVELKDAGSQTDQLNAACEASTVLAMSLFDKQKLELQEVLKEKEREAGEVLKELETKLERKHCETMASQVETALTQAHAKWLQELTELEEYKANLKVERDKWEKENEIKAAKQLSLVLSAAEEKWKKELENAEKSGTRIKELEEKIISLRRELEIKKDEIPATVKAEVAKARAQWNKEKQEEILQIQEQNERDYRSFLDDHRNKIKEVLATAKDDLVKQKNELLAQKEAEIKSCLDQKQREWTAQETKRLQEEIHQHKEKVLVELEHLLGEIHEELVKSTNKECSQQDNSSSTPAQLNSQYKERLKTCLEKVYRGTVHTLLEKAKQEWREKQEELVSNLKKKVCSCVSGEEETGDKARPPMYDVGHQLEIHRIIGSQMPLQGTEMEKDQKCKQRNLSCECCCQALETKERECQDLKRKLEKTCRHLQLAVREHKAKAEQIQKNERVLEVLMDENSEMKTKLKDLRTCDTPPRSLSEGAISKPCASCDGLKGLEEMRAQYIRAVGKIKSDMLHYIHESKERAAEMIKAEVLRERQETARKMRKYYLICLQQLLSDNGKYEGAEKKIMNAASKLATMAKVLDTPVPNTTQSKNTHSVLPLNSELPTGVEQSKRNYMHQSRPTHMESKSCGKSIAKKASDQIVQKRVPYNLRQQLDAAQAETLSLLHGGMTLDIQNGSTAKQLADTPQNAMSEIHPYEHERRNKTVCVSNTEAGLINATSITALQQAPTCVSQMKLGNLHTSSNINGVSDSRPSPVLFERQNERPALKEVKCYQPNGNWKAASERAQDLDVQEAPVRDEGGCTDWSSISGSLNLDNATGDICLLYPVQKTNSNTLVQLGSYEQSSMTRLFTDEDTGPFCKELISHETKILSAKNRDSLHCKDHQDVNSGCTSYQISDKASSALVQVSVTPYSNVGKGHNQHLRKAVLDAKSFQQDSGFDSPFANLD